MRDANTFDVEIRSAKQVCTDFAKEKGLSDACYITHAGCFISCGSSSVEIMMAAMIKEIAELKAKLQEG